MKSKKGISLIVLIITIIVVIILAAAVILSLNNNNPISSAKEATFKSDMKNIQYELSMYISKQYTVNNDFNPEKLNLPNDEISIVDALPSTKNYQNKVEVQAGILVWKFSGDKIDSEKTQIEIDQENWFNSIVGKSTVNKVPDNWKEHIAKVTDEHVPIPKGFIYVTGAKDTGVVIEDSIGNQFVWVPAKVDTYIKDFSFQSSYGATNLNTTDDTLPNGISDEISDVEKYGGFYIGRYEAGVPDNQVLIDGGSSNTSNTAGIPTSKKGKSTWTSIDYNNSKTSSEMMYTKSNSSSVKSGLLTGRAWDTTCKWIEKSGENITDSRNYGNHSNSLEPANISGFGKKQITGFSDRWCVNNIYDLAGNIWEWTSEKYVPELIVYRGGGYNNGGEYRSLSYRTKSAKTDTFYTMGFRVRLYIL